MDLAAESNNLVSVTMNSSGAKIQGSMVRLGNGSGSQTTLTQSAGTVSSTGDLLVGYSGQATYALSGSSPLISTGGSCFWATRPAAAVT